MALCEDMGSLLIPSSGLVRGGEATVMRVNCSANRYKDSTRYTSQAAIIQMTTRASASQSEGLALIWRNLVR
jgi:hypothetical protein